MSCGSALARRCPQCGTEAPSGARFCFTCGTALGGDVAAAGTPAAAAPEAEPSTGAAPDAASVIEERRTVTVLFADISGYTAVAERLDHETVKRLMDRCLSRLAAEVELYGGRVDKYIGDNVMAVFGAPVAHEDDAERAVRAALGMQEAMVALNSELEPEFGLELALRVGINTGEVLAGHVGDTYTVLGDAVNVAARLQAAAPDGGVIVGERTQRLSAEAIAYRRLEPLALKGKSEPVPAWEAVEAATAHPARAELTSAAPLIGREEELVRLQAAYERVARESAPHLVTIIGQAGVGKTRLLLELEHRLQRDDAQIRVRRGRCLALGAGVVYWPLVEMIRAECGIGEGDDAEQARAKLDERLRPLLSAREDPTQAERRLLALARLLGATAAGEEPAGAQEDLQSARESFFGAVRAVLEALASEQPLVLAWEDIHWADEETLDLIDYLSRWLRAPVLQVCLARDELVERRPGWTTVRRSATAAFLEPLAPEQTRELIEVLLAASGAQAEIAGALAERSGGNPLFAEAIVRRIAEEGGSDAEMPETIQGLLAARLDALDPFERLLVQHAAVLGRTFWESALAPVAVAAGSELEPALASLREKDLLVPSEEAGQGGERELAFKHVLIRDVAYEMLPKATRARKHAEVGLFIQEHAGGGGEGVVALIAEHCSRAARLAGEAHLPAEEVAAMRGRALEFEEAAGDAAAALYANAEALARYEAAEALAQDDGEALHRIAEKGGDVSLRLGRVEPAIAAWERCLAWYEQRAQLEHVAELHRKVGAALAHKGERKEAIKHHQQGINLIKDAPPSLALVRLYEEAAWQYMLVGDNMLAIYAAEKALRLAEELGELRAASRAHGIFGRVFGRIGDAAKARENLERAVELARESDAGETVLALLALGHDLESAEGDYAAAQASYAEGLELAERIGDVPAQIELRSALGQIAFYRCDWDEVGRAADASMRLAEQEGLLGKQCLANILRGRLAWREGDLMASARLFTTAREQAERVGWSEVSYTALTALATTLYDGGDADGASAALADALAVCERAGLAAPSIQVYAAIAEVEVSRGRMPEAREAAHQAGEVSERVFDPAGKAAALEAQGVTADGVTGVGALTEARAGWERLGRSLDVARCELLIARISGDGDAAGALRRAAEMYEQLGVSHLAAASAAGA
jgi:class 3 adenylate cyclase